MTSEIEEDRAKQLEVPAADSGTFERLFQAVEENSSIEKSIELLETSSHAVSQLPRDQLGAFFLELSHRDALLRNPSAQSVLESVFRYWGMAIRRAQSSELDYLTEEWIASSCLEKIYLEIPAESNARNQLLGALAAAAGNALKLFSELIVVDPPSNEKGILVAFAPLVDGRRQYSTELLFPKLLEALKYKHLAAIILDLSNYCFRNKLVSTNPAAARVSHLASLLGQVVSQLELIEEGQFENQTPQQISDNVNESVALTVALCDTLALSDYREGIGKIRQALELKHRRVKTEAAAALIRLGDTEDEEGKRQLIALTSEPICRLRAISYANELNLSDEVDEKYTTDEATAESQLAIWLASPGQMGVAPTTTELIYQRALRWPGFETQIKCFLFQFEYRFAGKTYSNIALAGPMTHAFAHNLEHLDEIDILSAYAGWQTQHEDIYTVDFERARQAIPGVTESLMHRLRGSFREVKPAFVGFFFETPALVAEVSNGDGEAFDSLVVCDRENEFVYPVGSPHSPITPELAFEIYKGHQLLHAFNDLDE